MLLCFFNRLIAQSIGKNKKFIEKNHLLCTRNNR